MTRQSYRPGDIVEVLPFHQLQASLDANGSLDNLPLMPEMVQFCGRKFRVNNRILTRLRQYEKLAL